MRLIGTTLLQAYPKKIVNIHPSLLPIPKYKGKSAIERAIEQREKFIGVTIHYVDEGMDTGEIIVQEKLAVAVGDSMSDIVDNIHRIEHRLYPQTIQQLLTKKAW